MPAHAGEWLLRIVNKAAPARGPHRPKSNRTGAGRFMSAFSCGLDDALKGSAYYPAAIGGVVMKKLPLLLSAVFTASLLSTSAVADPSAAASGPRPKTDWALACLLGFGPQRCQDIFTASRAAYWSTTSCTHQYVHRWLDGCPDGPLETVDYLGTNAAGADVYEIRYMNTAVTAVIAPPGPDGRIEGFWIGRGLPIQIIPSALVNVTAPAAQKTTLYRRPWQ